MNTIDKINQDAVDIINKLKRGETISVDESVILEIYNKLNAKKAFNAGRRKQIKTGK